MTAETIRRVQAAKPLILSGMPIWKAAIEVGWASPSLQIAFKKLEGMTPGEWVHSLPKQETRKVYRRTKEQADNHAIVKAKGNGRANINWLCASCGGAFGSLSPERCPKCGSCSFEKGRLA